VPLPRALGRFNRRITNRLLWPIVRWLPGFARVVHVGRRSGRTYRTPVLAFRDRDRILIALTYGPRTDWARNVLAAGGATLETRRQRLVVTRPELVRDPSHRAVPAPVALVLRAARAADYLVLRASPPARHQVVA
jgi:deazaflavin-dependent oxidoreductase (nitroreductase family)